MKRPLLILMVFLIAGCGGWGYKKANIVNLSDQLIDCQKLNYSQAVSGKDFLWRTDIINDNARVHINKVALELFNSWNSAVDSLASYRAGDIEIYVLQYELNQVASKVSELSSTMKVYYNVLEVKDGSN